MGATKIGAVLAVLALGGGVWADSARKEYTETVELSFPLNAGGEFSLENHNGALEITTSETNEVRIVAEKRMLLDDGAISWLRRLIGLKPAEVKSDEDARTLFEELRIEATGDENLREVKTVYPESTSGVNFSVRYRVALPQRVNVRADLKNGAIRMEDLTGDVDVQTVNGAVTLDGVTGRAEARTTNGRVHIDSAGGAVIARTTNGAVSVQLAEGDGGDVELRTVNGSVTLYVPEDAAFRLDARTTHGGIGCDLTLDQIDEQDRRELRGSTGQGGPLFSLRTTNGSARVKRTN